MLAPLNARAVNFHTPAPRAGRVRFHISLAPRKRGEGRGEGLVVESVQRAIGLYRSRLGFAPSSPRRRRLSASYSW